MSNQVNIFLLLFGGLQGFLVSLLLIKKRSYHIGYGFLIAYLLLMIAQVLCKVMSKVWLMDNMGPYYFLSYKFPLLYGPLVLLFTRNILKQRQSNAVKDILHFIPFLFAAVFTILSNFYFLPAWMEFLFDGISGTSIQLISLFLYHYFAMVEWQRHYSDTTQDFSGTRLLRMQWLRQFIIFSAIACLTISLLLYFMYQYHPTLHFLRWGFSLLSFFIYWISYAAINKPVLFSIGINEIGDQTPLQ